jgi:hypothetical protein
VARRQVSTWLAELRQNRPDPAADADAAAVNSAHAGHSLPPRDEPGPDPDDPDSEARTARPGPSCGRRGDWDGGQGSASEPAPRLPVRPAWPGPSAGRGVPGPAAARPLYPSRRTAAVGAGASPSTPVASEAAAAAAAVAADDMATECCREDSHGTGRLAGPVPALLNFVRAGRRGKAAV